jgi:hypothetical protein
VFLASVTARTAIVEIIGVYIHTGANAANHAVVRGLFGTFIFDALAAAADLTVFTGMATFTAVIWGIVQIDFAAVFQKLVAIAIAICAVQNVVARIARLNMVDGKLHANVVADIIFAFVRAFARQTIGIFVFADIVALAAVILIAQYAGFATGFEIIITACKTVCAFDDAIFTALQMQRAQIDFASIKHIVVAICIAIFADNAVFVAGIDVVIGGF